MHKGKPLRGCLVVQEGLAEYWNLQLILMPISVD
jgi:hypothetical protein